MSIKLPRHVQVVIPNKIIHLDSTEEIEEVVYEFDYDTEEQKREKLNEFLDKYPQLDGHIRLHTELCDPPKQTDQDLYESLLNCVEVADSECQIDTAEYNFLTNWLKEHFNIK